jgi:hypothetical protein
MKKYLVLAIVVFCAVALTIPASGQKEDYSGIWKLVREKSVIPEYFPALIKITVNVKGDSLLTERVYDTGDGSEYPFEENVTLDGKEYNINIFNMPRKSKAVINDQDGLLNFESTTTYEGSTGSDDLNSKEIWKVNKDSSTFVISFKNKSAMGENEGSFLFVKGE